jgi:hypothetical protein
LYLFNAADDLGIPRKVGTALHRNRSSVMSWLFLFLAGLFEIGWAVGLKHTDGFTRLVPSLLTAASMIVSLGLLGLALKIFRSVLPMRSGSASAPSAP